MNKKTRPPTPQQLKLAEIKRKLEALQYDEITPLDACIYVEHRLKGTTNYYVAVSSKDENEGLGSLLCRVIFNEYEKDHWRGLVSAPKDGTWVRLKLPDGSELPGRFIERDATTHWYACDVEGRMAAVFPELWKPL